MAGLIGLSERDLVHTVPPAGGEWIAVPAAFFVGGEAPAFALFDRNRRIADLRIARTVYVSEGDGGALSVYLRRRLPVLGGASPWAIAARAWALHRALTEGLAEVQQRLPEHPERPMLMRDLIELSRLAAEWVPAQPAPYLAELAHGEQSASAHGVTTALFALALCAAHVPADVEAFTTTVLAGLLADVGKLSMPAAIWQKSGSLSPEELGLARRHPERSVALLLRAGVRSVPTLRAVRWHHERWGGGGYPDRLRGNEIPVEARILGIADAFAALTTDRPFTTGVRAYDALTEMANSEGHFDPSLLRTFITTIGQVLPAPERWGAA
jgi:hypothetical protein